jgi:hypothetical protein
MNPGIFLAIKHLVRVLPLVLLLGIGTAVDVAAQSLPPVVEYEDGEFVLGLTGWTEGGSFLSQTPPATDDRDSRQAVSRVESGGTPGAFGRVEIFMPGLDAAAGITGTSATGTWGFLFNETATYDPVAQGPIDHINFHWDSRYTPLGTPFPTGDGTFEELAFVASSLAIRQYDEAQNRYLYWAVFARREFVRRTLHPDWTAFSILEIRQADFQNPLSSPWFLPGQAPQPDFSKPMTFGYVQGTSCNNQCRTENRTYFSRADIDNWRVEVEPAPSDCDTSPGRLRFTAAARSAPENAGTIPVEVSRVCGAVGEVSVPYLLMGVAPDIAVLSQDYRHPPGTNTPQTDTGVLVFGPGTTSRTIDLEFIDNDIVDGSRSLAIELQQPTGGAELADPDRIVVTILDDESGADLAVLDANQQGNGRPFPIVTSSLAFAGLPATFNELPYRFRVHPSLINLGPLGAHRFNVELRLPKLHLAGFGLENNGATWESDAGRISVTCEIPVVNDPDFVFVRCAHVYEPRRPYEIASGTRFSAIPNHFNLYVGYAGTVPAGMAFGYEVEVSAVAPPDATDANNLQVFQLVPQATTIPNPGGNSGGGGGSVSASFVALLSLLGLIATAGKRRRSSRFL